MVFTAELTENIAGKGCRGFHTPEYCSLLQKRETSLLGTPVPQHIGR